MPNQQVIELRNRILGVLIRNARERARFSRKACADVLGVSLSRFAAYEGGTLPVSLPELELLGRVWGCPCIFCVMKMRRVNRRKRHCRIPRIF
jgi:predicted transcriptional regulator